MKREKTLEEQLYFIGLFFLTAGVIGFPIYFGLIMPNLKLSSCMFLQVFGFYCPGCGGTRAVQALFVGNILKSLWYHPLVLYTLVIFGGFMLTQTLKRLHVRGIKGWKVHGWHFYGAAILLSANWILKNILLIFFHYEL